MVVEADMGSLRDIEINGMTDKTRIIEIEGITTVVRFQRPEYY